MVGPGEPMFVAVISHTHVALNEALLVEPWGIDNAPLCFKSGFAIASGVPRNFFGGGVQQIQLRTEDRENGDLGM